MRNLSKRHIVLAKLKAPSSHLAIEPSPYPELVVYLVFQPAGSSRHLSLGFSVRMRKRFSRHFSCWNLIKKINLWTFDSRRDTKYNGARSPIFCSVRVSRKPKNSNSNCTQTLIDGTHDAAGELPPKATERFAANLPQFRRQIQVGNALAHYQVGVVGGAAPSRVLGAAWVAS